MLSTYEGDSGDDNDDASYEEVGDEDDNEVGEDNEEDQHWRAGLGQQVETFYIASKCVTRLDTLFIVVCLGNMTQFMYFTQYIHLQLEETTAPGRNGSILMRRLGDKLWR